MSIDCTVAGGRDDPSRRVRGSAITWPSIARNNERVLDGILGHSDVAKDSYQGRNGLAIRLSEHALNLGRISMTRNGARHPSVTT